MQKDNKTLLEELGIDTSKIRNGHAICPKCSHLRKKKTDPCLSVNVIKGVYHCHNDSCDFKGGVNGAGMEEAQVEMVYVRPVFRNTTQVGDKWVKWFQEKRGIGQVALNNCKVTQSSLNGTDFVNFNFFRDGELINVKYRDENKGFRLERDAELIFYGLDDIKNSDWCVIVEGEMDKLAFAHAGVMEVVSVPNGANVKTNNLGYLDTAIDYFKNKKKIILATDADEAGYTLRDELARRLGHDVCFKVDFKGYKDANDFLIGKSATELKEVLSSDNLIEFPMDGIIMAEMMWDKVGFMLKGGLKRGALTDMIPELDDFISYVPGRTMVLTGIPNHGKSPFALMIMASLSLKHKWKWALFTPEHKPLEIFLVKICELLLGRKMAASVGLSTTEDMLCRRFINDHFFFIEPDDEDYTLDNILMKAKDLVTRKGIKGLLMDPWNKLEHNIPKGENETSYVSKQLDKIIRFNQRNGVFSILVAHPAKMKKKFKSDLYEVPSLYDISGSSNWFNKPDIGVTFYRNFHTGMSEVYIQKMKYDHLGKQGVCVLKWNRNNNRFNGQNADYDNSNWLLGKPHQSELVLTKEYDNQPTADLPF